MAGGTIDLWTTRRANFSKVRYWHRDESVKDVSELVHEKAPDGEFMAREISASTKTNDEIGGAFIFDADTITITTNDSIDIKNNDIAEYDGEPWKVIDVQRRKHRKESQFLRDAHYTTYVRMKR